VQMRVLIAIALLASLQNSGLTQRPTNNPAKRRLNVYSVNELAAKGVGAPSLWADDEPQSPLAEQRIVAYGPVSSCELAEGNPLTDVESGIGNTVHVIPWVFNFGSRQPRSYNTGIGTSTFSELNFDGAALLSRSTFDHAIADCKAASKTVSLTEPTFAVVAIVRRAVLTTSFLGGMKTFKSPRFVLLVEDVHFLGRASIDKKLGRIVLSDIAEKLIEKLATSDKEQ
jgi:hypothetical protein